VDRIEVVRSLGEQADALFTDVDNFLGGHADMKFVEDVAARRML